MAFMAIGQDNDEWRVEADETHTGRIITCRTDRDDHPIMIKIEHTWIPWANVKVLINLSEQNRKRTSR